ncbi:MAG: VCBS repeat-containing protein [Chlorobi bacterium CHB2]|nr:VCBS repeat-containing protein [Chlorobi bacterium CHB2]
MDGKAGDEVMLAAAYYRRNGKADWTAEVWIYQGGAGFQADTPTKILRDNEPTTSEQFYTAQILDIDGDEHLDLVTVGQYVEGYKLKIWFGTETSPWTWTQPDREITLYNTIGIYYPIFADFDGDRKTDIAGVAGPGTINKGVFLYLSRSEHDFRILSFSLDNSDRSFSTSASTFSLTASALNDSTERIAMLPLFGETVARTSTLLMMLSGSTIGPNGAYDAFYSTEDDGLPTGGIIGNITFSLDANNDGWQDYGTANAGWPEKQSGIAVILAGGPYIPLDDPTVSVRTEPMANHQRGLYLWPNPATTELNLAWRGDLATMPTRFSIHDIAGKLITENEIRPERGAARWSTAAVPSGTYLLTAYDRSGKVLASTQILVQH